MVDTTRSDCIYHPSKPATNWCKQCGSPTCHRCTVTGPSGKFCSDRCREIHEAFARHAQAVNTRAPSTLFVKIRSAIGSLLVLSAVCLAIGVVATVIEIPVVSALTRSVRSIIGI